MPLSSQEVKERLAATEADRPYRTVDEQANSLRGRIGLGRTQQRGAEMPTAPESHPAEDATTPVPGRMDFDQPGGEAPPEPPSPPSVEPSGPGHALDESERARRRPDWPRDVEAIWTNPQARKRPGVQPESWGEAIEPVLRAIGVGQSALDIVTINADALIPGSGQGVLKGRYDHYIAAGLDPDVAANATMRDYGDALGTLAEDPNAPGVARVGAQGARVLGTAQSLTAPAPVPGGASIPFVAGAFRRATEREIRTMLSKAATLDGVAARLDAVGMKAEAAKAVDEAKALREAADAAKTPPKPPPTKKPAEPAARSSEPTEEELRLPPRGRGATEPPVRTGQAPVEAEKIRYPTEENLGIPKADMESLPTNLRSLVAEEARRDYDEVQRMRGGVVPRAQVDIESERILVDAGILAQVAPRTPITAPGMKALRKALWRVAGEREAMEKEAERIGRGKLDDAFRARFLVKVFEQNSLQRVIAGARAEWGRVGQAMQGGPGATDAVRLRNTYQAIVKAVGGRQNVDAIMEHLAAIRNDPMLLGDPYAKTMKQLRYIDSIRQPTTWAKLREAWVNAILSITRTHEAYVLGQAAFHELEALAKLPTTVVDQVVRRVWRADAVREGGTYSFNRALAGTAASHTAIPRGWLAAFEAIRSGATREEIRLFDETGQAFPHALVSGKGPLTEKLIGANVPVLSGLAEKVPAGADVLRLPTRLIGGYTAAFHEVGRETKLWELAAGKVEKEAGQTSILSREFRRRMAIVKREIEDGQHPELAEQARKAGQRASLRNEDPNYFARLIRSARDYEVPANVPVLAGARPLYRVMPFVNIGFNIAQYGLEYSPLGFLAAVTATGARRSEAIAHAGLGSILWKVFWDKSEAGEMTGAEPEDEGERGLWQREGKQPYSIRIGGEWYPIDRYEPAASTLKWMAGLNQAWHDLEKDVSKGTPLARALVQTAMGKVLGTMAEGYLDMSWMTGISQIVRTVQAPDKVAALDNYFGQQLTSQIPFSGEMKRVAQGTDPFVRRPRGTIQQIEAAIPGLSPLVPAATDTYGEAVRRPESQQGIRSVIDPFQGRTEKRDPVDEELMKHQIPSIDPTQPGTRQIFATMAQKEIASFKLTPEEGEMLQTLAGRATHQQLAALFVSEKYRTMEEPQKVKAIQKTITDARATARGAVADAILHQAATAPETARAVDMKLSLHGSRWERALLLEGVSRLPQWTAQASKLVGERLATQKGQPSVAEYMRAAPYVRQYLSAPAFDRVLPGEVGVLEEQKREHSDLVVRDRLDGTKTAEAYLRSHPLLLRYENEPVSAARERVIEQARRVGVDLGAYVQGARYTVTR